MNNQSEKIDDTAEIDIKRLSKAVWHKLWIVVLVTFLCVAISFVGTYYLITPKYQSSAMFYVNNNSNSVEDSSLSISSSDITAAKNLVDSYIVILKTRASLNDVIAHADVNRTYTELINMISAAPVNSTEIFEVVVTSHDAHEAELIANAIAHILPEKISGIIEGTSAKVVDYATIATKPSFPNYTRNIMLGVLVGFVLSVGAIVLRELFTADIRAEEDIYRCCNYDVFVAVPDMTVSSERGYYRKFGRKRTYDSTKRPKFIGKEISFAAAEAYKLLRTKLQYSFDNENTCHVISISGTLTGEGKSLTAINLAYTISQLGSRVLLIDCDMRCSSLSSKLSIEKSPGLSNFLLDQEHIDALIRICKIHIDSEAFDVISSGKNPTNPAELLGSARMAEMLCHLRRSYDYIILDLPPVGEVSDALAVAKEADGILLVVRQNYCKKADLSLAIRQFEFIESKILGIVYNCSAERDSRYNKRYYKKFCQK